MSLVLVSLRVSCLIGTLALLAAVRVALATSPQGNVPDLSVSHSQGEVALLVESDSVNRGANSLGSDGAAFDHFGYSIAVSGSYAVVGAPQDAVGGRQLAGGAYVYSLVDDQWVLVQKLVAADLVENARFGHSVAMDGDTMVIGAPWVNSAYVFERSGAQWLQKKKLTRAGLPSGASFGSAVSVHGGVIAVGAWGAAPGGGIATGAVYLFERQDAQWLEVAALFPPDGGAQDFFGFSVSLSANALAIGAYGHDATGSPDQGAVYVFAESPSGWRLQQKLLVPLPASDRGFGRAVALAGGALVVGAHLSQADGSAEQGTAYAFSYIDGSWLLQSRLLGPGGVSGDRFGAAVAIHGGLVVVGAFSVSADTPLHGGKMYLFRSVNGDWTFDSRLDSAVLAGQPFFTGGLAVFQSDVFVGSHLRQIGPNLQQGGVRVVDVAGIPVEERQDLNSGIGINQASYGSALATDGRTAVVGAPRESIGDVQLQGAVYIYVRQQAGWMLQAKLTADDARRNDRFGSSVALAGNWLVVGAPNRAEQGAEFSGAVYFFEYDGLQWQQRRKLTAPVPSRYQGFGASVALTPSLALVGVSAEPFDSLAYVFKLEGGLWHFQQTLIPPPSMPRDGFGRSVALSEGLAVVGAPLTRQPGVYPCGSIYPFIEIDGQWVPEGRLTSPDNCGPREFGHSVALSGSTLVVGQYNFGDPNFAYVYQREGFGWSFRQRLAADPQARSQLGHTVAINGDVIVVSDARATVDSLVEVGSVHLYRRTGGGWQRTEQLIESIPRQGSGFGSGGVAYASGVVLVQSEWFAWPAPFGNLAESNVLIYEGLRVEIFASGFE